MGRSLPILNIPSLPGALGSFRQQITQFLTPSTRDESPSDGRTVDDFKPYLVALNLTKRCNLKCDHCYLDATTKAAGGNDELSTEECFRLIDQIAEVNKGCLLVITGGEPLVRPDILDIARHAVNLGFMVVFGTNGMLINDQMAKTPEMAIKLMTDMVPATVQRVIALKSASSRSRSPRACRSATNGENT